MEEMLMLGAGASIPARVPGAYEMTKRVDNALFDLDERQSTPPRRRYSRVIRFVIGRLLAHIGERNYLNQYPDSVDVETLLSAVKDLADRRDHHLAAFVSSWSAVLEEFERELPFTPGATGLHDFPNMLQQIVVHETWLPNDAYVSYLTPIFGLLKKQSRLVIASLNYDNSVELAAQTEGVSCDTGLATWNRDGRFRPRPNGLSLLKLHGSTNWGFRWVGPPNTAVPTCEFVEVASEKEFRSDLSPALILGHGNKLTAEGPFLDLLASFAEELAAIDRLTVVGYSFRDDHVNEYITRWLNGSAGRSIRVVDPGFANSGVPYAGFLRALRQHDPSRVLVESESAETALSRLYP